MNRRQRSILLEIISVIAVTIIAIVAMYIVRNYVNRREAELAITILGNRIKQYRVENGLVPPENWVNGQRENLPGEVRLGRLNYRGRWIDVGSDPDDILAYTEHESQSLFFKAGYFVLRLGEVLPKDSSVADESVNIVWMEAKEFETELAEQQSQIEIEFLNR